PSEDRAPWGSPVLPHGVWRKGQLMSTESREIDADYERAHRDAYDGLVRAGRTGEADKVADILAKRWKSDPRPKADKPPTAAEKKAAAEKAKAAATTGAKETAAATPAPENTADTGSKE